MRIVRLLSWGLVVSLAACPSRDISAVDTNTAGETLKDIPISADIDILFVIDNSSSTTDKQNVFAANFSKFIEALDKFPNGRPNVHIGVVSSTVDVGVDGIDGCPHPNTTQDGRLQNTTTVSGCSVPSDRYLIDVKQSDGSRMTNYTGDLATAFGCIATLGDQGCGFEAQLEGMKRALDGSRPENAKFLRPEAFLAVVILTDEDDCSVRDAAGLFGPPDSEVGPADFRCQPFASYTCDQPISPTTAGSYTNCKVKTVDSLLQDPGSYATFLTGLKGSVSRVVVALIGGDAKTNIATGELAFPSFTQPLALLPSCMATISGRQAVGRPGIRLASFLGNFGTHGLFRTVCAPDYGQALTDIGQLLFTAVTPCLEGNVDPTDLDAAAPGIQLGCTVSDVLNIGTPNQTESVIPRCEMTAADTPAAGGTRPCWWVISDPTACTTGTHLELHIERTTQPASGTNVQARCPTL